MLFVFFYLWLRATLPRYRYDQITVRWKILIPVTLVWFSHALNHDDGSLVMSVKETLKKQYEKWTLSDIRKDWA